MRTNLIMHFHCSECGRQLNIANERERKVEPKYEGCFHQNPEEPTGAACHYTPKISVEPCRNCIEKYTGPARKLAEALSEFKDS